MSVKLERLQALLAQPDFAAWVPPLFPLPVDDARTVLAQDDAAVDGNILRAAYARHLAQSQSELAQQVAAQCGPAPWIVRSAGQEDGHDFVNAGGYDSLICADASALAQTIAQVTFSGFDQRALSQLRLTNPTLQPQPIACFVQPLIAGEQVKIPSDEAPYFTAEACAELLAIIERLHFFFEEPALDTEWALETDQGLVSVTGLTVKTPQGVLGQLTFGFGFAAAQTPGERVNALAYTWPDLRQPLWRAGMQRQVAVRKHWLVQVRPALGFQPLRRIECLTTAARVELTTQYAEVAVAPLIRPSTPRQGRFLAAVTLDEAWGRYLKWPEASRAELAAVLVETGEAAEHAGIMFRQQALAVYRTPLALLPNLPGVVVDPLAEHAWFGAAAPSLTLATEAVACLDLPAGLQLIFDDSDAAMLGEQSNPATLSDAIGRLLDSAPGAINARARQSMIQRSLWPQPDSWLRIGASVRSPSLLGFVLAHGLEQALWAQSMPAGSMDYLDAYASKRDPAACLPQLLAADPSLHSKVSNSSNVRLLVQLLRAEHWARQLGVQWLAPLLNMLDENPPTWLDVGLSLLAATERLPIYQREDRLLLLQMLCSIAATDKMAPADLVRAMRPGVLAPTALANLLQAPAAVAAYLDYVPALTRFRIAGVWASLEEANALRHAAAALERVLREHGHETLWGLVRSDLIDAFDQILKAVLAEVVDRSDTAVHGRYLALLANWIDFARTQTTAATDQRAFDTFKAWLEEVRQAPLPAHFLLGLEDEVAEQLGDAFVRWPVVMPIAGTLAPAALPFANAHQLHNLLHQWLLAHCRVETGPGLPQGLCRLLGIADGFGDARSSLLKLGPALMEISLPMVVHKASFLFTEHDLTVEFAEIPDAPQEEIGRLIVIETLIRRIGAEQSEWVFSSHRICQFGTWVLYLRAKRTDGARFTSGDLQQLLLWLRVLFDSAYDFSYVPNEAVAHVDQLFASPAWGKIFLAYADYRAMIDYARQRPPVYVLPFATTLAALCLDAATRDAVQAGFLSGFDGASHRLEAACIALYNPAISHDEWASEQATAGQLAVLLSAAWPVETLERLAANGYSAAAGEFIGQSLLHRRDLALTLRQRLNTLSPSAPLYRLALRYAPDVVIDPTTACAVADQVLSWRRTFKRCKEYLLAYHAVQLSDAQCDRLIKQLDLIPQGIDAEAEDRIQQALERLEAPWGRLSLLDPDYITATRSLATGQKI